MISRLTSEPRMPSWPIEMPSLTAIVTNSSGNPPASRTPSFARFASRSSGMLHGVTSFQLDATPTCALPQSPSVMPTARNIARAGARSMPSVTSWLRGFMVVGSSWVGMPTETTPGSAASDACPRLALTAMKIDAPLVGHARRDVPDAARAVEGPGTTACTRSKVPHDPFFPLVLAAEHTERLELATAIAVAFARNPMTLANIGYDLQPLSRRSLHPRARLADQAAHREALLDAVVAPRRARMRELVLAIRAIWAGWQDGTPLRFEGEFYRHTLMTPFFDPGPNPFGARRDLARRRRAGDDRGRGRGRRRLPGAPVQHRASTCASTSLPGTRRGAGRRRGETAPTSRSSFPVMIVTGDDRRRDRGRRLRVRAQIAFYGSTPAYRVVLDAHGWGDLQPELNRLSKERRWQEMSALIDDDMVDAFALRGAPEDARARCARAIRRPRSTASRSTAPYGAQSEVLAAMRGHDGRGAGRTSQPSGISRSVALCPGTRRTACRSRSARARSAPSPPSWPYGRRAPASPSRPALPRAALACKLRYQSGWRSSPPHDATTTRSSPSGRYSKGVVRALPVLRPVVVSNNSGALPIGRRRDRRAACTKSCGPGSRP